MTLSVLTEFFKTLVQRYSLMESLNSFLVEKIGLGLAIAAKSNSKAKALTLITS